ncbi:MAG: type II toxin-antitoxin system HicB family antitoxin [Thermoproteota archaeon]|nr:type II toxin-antitoxin system HicB family antitoxin [Thermoproteota archaeon]
MISSLSSLSEQEKAQRRATTTITFRINSDVMRKINAKAEQEDISLNTLINRILKRYSEWDMYEGKAGMISVNRRVIKTLFEGLSKEEVVKMSREVAKNEVYNIALFMKGKSKLDVDSFISWFLSRMKNCTEITENKENYSKIYILKHDLGENWSLYHKTVLDSIFMDYLQTPLQTSITDSTIVFTVDDKDKGKQF